MDLLIFAIIAIYFIYKLNNVLGNKSFNYDSQKTRTTEFREEIFQKESMEEKIINAKVELSDEEAIFNKDSKVIEILKQIRNIDKIFTEAAFIKSASAAFEMILNAYTQNDKNTLKMLLSNNIYQEFLSHIEDKEKKQILVEQSLVTLKNVEIIRGKIQHNQAYLTVQYSSEQIYVIRDKNQIILEGHPSKIISKKDLWTFTKDISKSEPIWELMATE